MSFLPARRVLVPVDLTPSSRAAWAWAKRLAAPGARLEVLYVHETPPAPLLGLPAPFLSPAQRRHIARRLEKAYPGARARVEVGGVAPAIIARAAEADLVVMASHDRRGWDRLLRGSVCEAVVRAAKVPVLVVKNRPGTVSSVLSPVNLKPYSRKGLAAGAEAARFLGARHAVLFVDRDPFRGANPRFFLTGMLARLPAELRAQGAPKLILRGGEAVPAILGASARHQLVVLTAHRKSLLSDAVLGTTAERVLRFSRAPVLTVPSGRYDAP